jgi:hypothetical protein
MKKIICRNCKSQNFKKIFRIGKQVISSVFYDTIKKKLPKYSLDLLECNDCNLIQLGRVAPSMNMYGTTYGYRTSLSPFMVKHMNKKFRYIKELNIIKEKSSILDIGSNDGTFLNFFAKKFNNINIFGIDPSAKKFNKFYNKKINLLIDYFSRDAILKNIKNNKIKKKFSVITSFAMFYDIEQPNKFCRDINLLLDSNGIWILELSYFPLLLSNLTYDQICHEHVTYYTIGTIKKILDNNSLKILDYNLNEINGGSIEIICAKKNAKYKAKKKKIEELFKKEELLNQDSYKEFQLKVNNVKDNVNLIFDILRDSNKIIFGYGASTKGNIFLNHCSLNSSHIRYICDANPEKIGKYTPGSNIKIISKEKMRELKPDYLLVLIWSFKSEVIQQEINYLKNGGQLIFFLPVFHVVNFTNYKMHLRFNLSNL